jgi:hypothetical protein
MLMMKMKRECVELAALSAPVLGDCTATLSQEDQAKLDAGLKAAGQAAASESQADASAMSASASGDRAEAAAASVEDSAAKATKAFEMGLRN